MKILMVVAYFVPEIGSAAHVYFDLAKAFVKRGHEVDIITSYPRKFNLIKDDINKSYLLNEVISGINVHRCEHMSTRDDILLRGFEHFLLPIHYFLKYLTLKKRFDLCLIYIPPLPLYYFTRAIKKYDGTPSILNFQDFHPQELTDVGILKNGLMKKILEHIERVSYRNADYITVLSKNGIEYIIERGGNPSKIEHIYNGCSISDLNKFFSKTDFKKKEDIERKFLISYAGILSPFQGIDNLLDAARELISHNDIIFYIVGDGMLKAHLEYRIQKEAISNIKLMPLQPRDEYFNIIASSDISLISLDERMKAPCIPGKLANLLAVKKPLIAVVSEESETARIIQESKGGIVVGPRNLNELNSAILKIKNNSNYANTLGINGANFIGDNMDLKSIVKKYEKIFEKVSGAKLI